MNFLYYDRSMIYTVHYRPFYIREHKYNPLDCHGGKAGQPVPEGGQGPHQEWPDSRQSRGLSFASFVKISTANEISYHPQQDNGNRAG